MNELSQGASQALALLLNSDAQLLSIVALSMTVSACSVLLASSLALPFGAWLGMSRFPGRELMVAVLNGLMGLPPVVVGLLVYLLLSRAGPLGHFGILFTPTAMVCAQALLIFPIIAALTRQIIEESWAEYREQLLSLNASRWQALRAMLWDMRLSIITAVLAGFGRSAAEVGAVMIVGGNIDGLTRVMTTAIALETSKGDFPLALALGLVLIGVVILVNVLTQQLKGFAQRHQG
jgi:tungstate transport system permease protein